MTRGSTVYEFSIVHNAIAPSKQIRCIHYFQHFAVKGDTWGKQKAGA